MKTSNKSRFLVSTETTELQEETELECEPFFVNLRTLTFSQVEHLRQVGLLCPPPSTTTTTTTTSIDETIIGKEDHDVKNSKNNNDDDNNENGADKDDDDDEAWAICLFYQKHAAYLHRVFETSTTPLAASFVSLDASHPWMIYWCLQACDLLNDPDQQQQQPKTSLMLLPSEQSRLDVVHYLEQSCWQTTTVHFHPDQIQQDAILSSSAEAAVSASDPSMMMMISLTGGGFGGGPGQMPHCATTYASILSLCIIATTATTSTDNKDDDDDTCTTPALSPSSVAAWQLLEKIRIPLYIWLVSLQQPDTGGFAMHVDGEVDVRAVYIALCIMQLLGLLHQHHHHQQQQQHPLSNQPSAILQGALKFCASCQTYEGGFGSEPGSEAHSGYTFCAMAALQWIQQHYYLDEQSQQSHSSKSAQESQQQLLLSSIFSHIQLTSLRDWLTRRQMSFEGGFSGRTNKLVDGCYSFWQGGSICILEHWLALDRQQQLQQQQQTTANKQRQEFDPWLWSLLETTPSVVSSPSTNTMSTTEKQEDDDHNRRGRGNHRHHRPFLLMDQAMLQRYILLCCQDAHGGLRDKPSKPRDFYHSCYVLSGLSVSQLPLGLLLSPTTITTTTTAATATTDQEQQDDDDVNEVLLFPSPAAAPVESSLLSSSNTANSEIWFGHKLYSRVHATHPCYNIRIERVQQVLQHFSKQQQQ